MAKILVVEDDVLIAMELGERLAEMGYAVLGPAHSIAEAEALIAGERPTPRCWTPTLAGQSERAAWRCAGSEGRAGGVLHGLRQGEGRAAELANAPILTKPVSDAELRAGLGKAA